MRRRSHISLYLIATSVWAAFLIGGLPSYYQQYSTATMAMFDLVVLVPIAGAAYFVLRQIRGGKRLRVSLWIAFYFTVPLAVYDWLYCGVYLGHGMEFVRTFWYLSVYYVIPWILLPVVALTLDRRTARVPATGGSSGGSA